MNCIIEWNTLSVTAWEERFARIRRANLLQSYGYALAVCALQRQSARWGLIRIDGAEAGLVQVIEARALGGALHAVIVDRGPLWFEGFGSNAQFKAFAEALNAQFPRRIGRRRRFIPEYEQAGDIPGFKKSAVPPYQTIWLDLCQSEETLRSNLKAKWRNALRKAEKAGLHIEWDEDGKFLPTLVQGYIEDKKTKGYDGPSVKLLTGFAKAFVPQRKMWIGRALRDDKLCASILVLCHGDSATYQIGWTTDTGRKTAAHQLLLWAAMGRLKDKGIKDFDLGGINDDSAKGVKDFKTAMGGQSVTLSGLYT